MACNSENQELTKKFFFQEIGKIVEFPNFGNHGKYINYRVYVKCKENVNGSVELVVLGEFLESVEVEGRYPHVVCYFKDSSGVGADFRPEYLEMRKIASVDDFWLFLNALNI